MGYAPRRNEPDPTSLLTGWLSEGRVICLPRVTDSEGLMEARQVASLSQLQAGKWGLMEPDPGVCPVSDPDRIDLVLVPGLGFDRDGNRLGRGKGFYDRFLGRIRPNAITLGLCYTFELVDSIPVDSDCDRPVAWLATPSGILQCR